MVLLLVSLGSLLWLIKLTGGMNSLVQDGLIRVSGS